MALDMSDPRTAKGILAALGLALLLGTYFFTDLVPFTYKAHASEVADLERQYVELSRDLNKARQTANRLPYLEREYALLERKWNHSRHLIPEESDMAWLLRTISLLGSHAGVEFTLFKPLSPRPAEFYAEIPVEVNVSGGYHQIGSFLGEIANLDRIVNVTQLELIRPPRASLEQPAEARFVAVTYTLRSSGDAGSTGSQVHPAGTPAPRPASRPDQTAGSARGGEGHE